MASWRQTCGVAVVALPVALVGTCAGTMSGILNTPAAQAQEQVALRIDYLLVNRATLDEHPDLRVPEMIMILADEGNVVIANYIITNENELLHEVPSSNVLTAYEASRIQNEMLTEAIPEIADRLRAEHPGAEFRTLYLLNVVIEDDQGPVYSTDYQVAFENNLMGLPPEMSGIPLGEISIDPFPYDGNGQARVVFDFSVASNGGDRFTVETAADAIPVVLQDVLHDHAVIPGPQVVD